MKYGADGPFKDPVLRCDSCNKLVKLTQLHDLGMCPHCGGKKVRNLRIFNDEEKAIMENWGVDPEFIASFGVRKKGDPEMVDEHAQKLRELGVKV